VGAAAALGGSIRDQSEHAVRAPVEFIVPDAQDRPAFAFQVIVSDAVRLRFRMLSAIELNDQLRLAACEIRSVRADRQLAGELGSEPGNQTPEFPLMPGGVVAEPPRALSIVVFNAPHSHDVASRASRTHP
jgi:hypothetical protein